LVLGFVVEVVAPLDSAYFKIVPFVSTLSLSRTGQGAIPWDPSGQISSFFASLGQSIGPYTSHALVSSHPSVSGDRKTHAWVNRPSHILNLDPRQ